MIAHAVLAHPMLPPTRFLHRAHHGTLPPAGDATCWLCAAPCPADGPRAGDVVRSTFADAARARRGGATEVCCPACAWYFDHKILRPGAKRAMGFFTKTIAATPDRWYEWERETMADDCLAWLRDGLPTDMLLTINYSKQKHVIPWAIVNPAGTRQPWIETDAGRLRVPADLGALLGAVAALWAAGHTKTAIAQAQLTPFVLARAARPAAHLALVRTLAPDVGSPLMDFLTYLVTEANRDRLAREHAAVL
jgi:hypothetical protein